MIKNEDKVLSKVKDVEYSHSKRTNPFHLLAVLGLVLALTIFYFAASSKWKKDQIRLAEAFKQNSQSKTSRLQSVMHGDEDTVHKFSAVQVVSDLQAAQEYKQDFLSLYLSRHFPLSIDESDIKALNQNIEELKNGPTSIRYQFKLGMYYFFLALAETKRLSLGEQVNPKLISDYWHMAHTSFGKAGEVGRSMAEEISKILVETDSNKDNEIQSDELVRFMKSHSSKR